MKNILKLGLVSVFCFFFLILLKPVGAEAKLSIPEDALLYNGHYYYYYEGNISWTDAQAECEKLGGHLVTFTDKDEENAIWEYIQGNNTPVWIGMYNAALPDRVYMQVKDLEAKWVTGEKVKYSNWAKGQPDGLYHFFPDTFELYAAMGTPEEVGGFSEGSETPCWGDFDLVDSVNNGQVKGYVCEWDIYEIEVEKKTVTLKKGKTYTISYTIYDAAGHVKVKKGKVTFKTGSKKIATVTKDGMVKAVKKGKTKIKLTYKGCYTKVTIKVK